MSKKWFQMSEQGAGTKRLILTKYIYDIFGEIPVRIIAFFVVLTVFIKAKERRRASARFYKILKKPPLMSTFKQFLNYGNTLVDGFVACLGKFDPQKLKLDNPEIYNGAFFITTHVGNVGLMRALFQTSSSLKPKRANVFLQADACKTFNDFLKTLEMKIDVDVFPVEEINAETSILISDRLKAGEIVFMAGDRVSAQNTNKVYEADFLGKKASLPIGTLKFALLMDCPIYFIVCIREGKNYPVFTRKFVTDKSKNSEKLEELKKAYINFLEEYTLKYPYQFYHFYDFWE